MAKRNDLVDKEGNQSKGNHPGNEDLYTSRGGLALACPDAHLPLTDTDTPHLCTLFSLGVLQDH